MSSRTLFPLFLMLTACGGDEPDSDNRKSSKSADDGLEDTLAAQAALIAELEARIEELEQREVLDPSALDGYATQSWVQSQGYATEAWVDSTYTSLAHFDANTVAGLPDFVSVDAGADEIVFSGVNVRLDNGLGASSSTNGVGNLILGYNEPSYLPGDRTGSHSLVIGEGHHWTGAGNIITGARNEVYADGAAVLGGWYHNVEGNWSVVLGGLTNDVSGDWAVSAAGNQNSVTAPNAVAIAGNYNVASGSGAVVMGGEDNEAAATRSVAMGGQNNLANGSRSVVTGGSYNETTLTNQVAP